MSDRDFEQLVSLVVEVCGEQALERAMARALWQVAHRPVDAGLRHLLPASLRETAVQIDALSLQEAVATELRHLVRPQ